MGTVTLIICSHSVTNSSVWLSEGRDLEKNRSCDEQRCTAEGGQMAVYAWTRTTCVADAHSIDFKSCGASVWSVDLITVLRWVSLEIQCCQISSAENPFDVFKGKAFTFQNCRADLNGAQGCSILTCQASSCWFTWSTCSRSLRFSTGLVAGFISGIDFVIPQMYMMYCPRMGCTGP